MRGIPALLVGAPLRVKPGQDYMTRLQTLLQFMQKEANTGRDLPEEGIQRIMERLEGLLKGYETVDMNGARKLRKEIANFFNEGVKAQQLQQDGVQQAVQPEIQPQPQPLE